MEAQRDSRFVLALVDGSPCDDDAVAWAVTEAAVRGLTLRLLHVIEQPDLPAGAEHSDVAVQAMAAHAKAARRIIDAARQRTHQLSPELRVEDRVRHGRVAPEALAEGMDAALVVLGSGRRADPGHAWLGSIAAHVTAHATCPVIVARVPMQGEPVSGTSRGRIVVGTDGSVVSHEAVGFAFEEAAWRGAGLTVVHAWQHTDDAAERWAARRRAEHALAAAVSGWREKYPTVPVQERLVHDHPVRALLEEASGALLLVVGSHGHGRFPGMLLGSVSQTLLRHAPVTLTVVRPRHPEQHPVRAGA